MLLTEGGKSHRRTQSCQTPQTTKCKAGISSNPSTRTAISAPTITTTVFLRDLFAGLPRNCCYPNQELQSNKNLSFQREARSHLDVAVSSQVHVGEKKLENINIIIDCTNSVLSWLDKFRSVWLMNCET
jgi:hypothetical protein